MHGDIMAENRKDRGKLIGGLALLSGYVNKVRAEEKNVLYVIAGDMLQGSIIDTEYKGLSTIEIMNYLAPDVVTIGNHEVDYGLPHLLFLEKIANFPIVNANLYIKKFNKRLMKPHLVIQKDGFDILFTGVITEDIMASINQDPLIGSFISLEEASSEVGKICNAYKHNDIDLTILLTHIGFESDKKLASLLHPDWGVDMIIGGHSHTILEKPEVVNNVLISQAAMGTDQIGRFDIEVDDETNKIVKFSWQLIPIEEGIAEPDARLIELIDSFKKVVDDKYNTILCKLTTELTHPKREIETSLGNYLADAFAENAECDVMFVGSGSIRVKTLGQVVTLMDFKTCFPYDDSITRFEVSGDQLERIFRHVMRNDNRNSEGECYQVNTGVEAIYDTVTDSLISLKVNGEKVKKNETYTIAAQGYHVKMSQEYLGLSNEELFMAGNHKVVTTSAQEVLEEYLRNHQNTGAKVEGRLLYR